MDEGCVHMGQLVTMSPIQACILPCLHPVQPSNTSSRLACVDADGVADGHIQQPAVPPAWGGCPSHAMAVGQGSKHCNVPLNGLCTALLSQHASRLLVPSRLHSMQARQRCAALRASPSAVRSTPCKPVSVPHAPALVEVGQPVLQRLLAQLKHDGDEPAAQWNRGTTV